MSNLTTAQKMWEAFALLSMGAGCSAVLFGELVLTRFSRYSRRGSNPPPPGRKPAPPAGPPDWRRSFTHECINPPTGKPPLKLRQREPAPPSDPPIYGWGPRQLNPPPPAPGMRREYLWSPTLMAECGGPCWEAQDPRCCDCGAMWRDVPICMDEGSAQRGNGSGGPTTPKPPIKPQPSGGRMMTIGYQPLPRSGRTLPPPREP
jgi:hypothetical protein